VIEFNNPDTYWNEIERIGHIPLPPYIKEKIRQKTAKLIRLCMRKKQVQLQHLLLVSISQKRCFLIEREKALR
jgi:S-adenosylmethionine:tRNA-ribosyltransferase-isomerase (queuine synthetase)